MPPPDAEHMDKSHVQVTGSHKSVPVPAPTLMQVDPPRFLGSQGVLPVPQATFVPASSGCMPGELTPASVPVVGFSCERPPEQAATARSSSANAIRDSD
jgi:hypothetical protein